MGEDEVSKEQSADGKDASKTEAASPVDGSATSTSDAVEGLRIVDRIPRQGGYLHDPPPDQLAPHRVDWSRFGADHIAELDRLIAESKDERPLQDFFRDHPHVLMAGVTAVMRESWVLAKPKFGAEYVPDYLLGIRDSLGPGWMVVEIESPTLTPINKDGSLSKGLNHAVQQVEDYRRWLGKHAAYFRDENGAWGIESGTTGIVVIGREKDRDNKEGADRLRDLRKAGIETMSYERILRNVTSQWEFTEARRQSLAETKRIIEERGRKQS